MRHRGFRHRNHGADRRARLALGILLGTLLALPAAVQAVDLVPLALERVDGGRDSPPPTPVRVRIAVRNAAAIDMPTREGPAGWSVQVQGYSANPYVVRQALRAGDQHSFVVTVVVPCGKATPLEVRVNATGSVAETNYDNNRAAFPIEGNACPIAVRSGVAHPLPDAVPDASPDTSTPR